MLPRVSRSSPSAHAVVFPHRAGIVSKRNTIAADLRAGDLEQIVFIQEHTVGVVGTSISMLTVRSNWPSLEDRVSGVRFLGPVKVHSV